MPHLEKDMKNILAFDNKIIIKKIILIFKQYIFKKVKAKYLAKYKKKLKKLGFYVSDPLSDRDVELGPLI